ncbi:T9SS type A sorting domain-containing protein [Psychroserpens mesophilus]|uniref:T9SS type A sorting domain-containing protein n=1 Tax=Psychroserpens mesophilus TaxID=325473 RepID=UPI003D647EA5
MKVKLLLPLLAFLFSVLTHAQIGVNPPIDLYACDNFNGFANFDLNQNDAIVLGGLSPNEYTVSYHMTQIDAETNTNALISPFSNTTNPQLIFVRVAEMATGNFEIQSFNLFVDSVPVPTLDDVYEFCDSFELVVDSGFGDQDFIFAWYFDGILLPDETDSMLTINQSGYYQLQVSTPDGCSSFTDFEVVSDTFENLTTPSAQVVCDDNNDGLSSFNLWDAINEIGIALGMPSQITIHETLGDAEIGVNAVNPVYNNIVPYVQTLYVNVSTVNTDCYGITTIDLIVDTNCVAASPVEAFICVGDFNIPVDYDLTSQEASMVNGQNTSDFTFTYYYSETNAQSQNNAITNPETFPVNANTPVIYVRIEDNQSGNSVIVEIYLNLSLNPQIDFNGPYTICSGNEIVLYPFINNNNATYEYVWNTGDTSPEIVVLTGGTYSVTVTDLISGCSATASVDVIEGGDAPILTDAAGLYSCEQSSTFDLTSTIPEILNGQDESQYVIGFYNNYNWAYADNNPITNPTNYISAGGSETIFVRVQNIGDECFSISNFSVTTDNSCPTVVNCENGPVNTTYCYDNNDTTEFNFQSSDGLPLTLYFNTGQTEVNFDTVSILDSDGSTMNSNLLYGNDGDFTGLTYTSTGSSITVQFNSDNTISCTNNSTCCNEEFDFNVFCASAVGIIQVNAFVDANSNDVYDANEFSFSNGYFAYEVNGDGMINTVNSSTGSFQIISENEADTYDITFNLHEESAGCYDITTAGFDTVSVTQGNTVTIDFPVVEEQSCEDLAVYLINYWTPPRPGFTHENYLVLENLGFTTITSGTVEFVADPQLVYNGVTSVNPNYTITSTATGFAVDFVNLQPGDVEYIDISLTCPATVALDDIVTNTATYVTDTNDLVPGNNYSTLSELVVGSWDPNDKMEAHGPKVLYDDFSASDEWLYYTIRFQNLGTAAAEFVRIEDELDASLDETTFQMLRSSHDYIVTRTESSLEWYFDNINLSAEQDDAEGSNGFVYFRIKPKAGYALGDVIPNTAAIYFDFNPPVITNRFETEFVDDALSVSEFDINGFTMYPNPAKDILTIKLNNISNAKLSIYDIQGKLVLERSISKEQNLELNVSDLQSGLYFVKLNTSTKEVVKKLIVE